MAVSNDEGKGNDNGCVNPFARFTGCGTGPFFGPDQTYPNQFEYDQDLVWLIKSYKYLLCQYNKLVITVDDIQQKLVGLDDYINQLLNQLMVPIYKEIGEMKQEIADFENLTNDKILEINRQVDQLALNITTLEVAMNSILPAAKKYADTQDEKVKDEIYAYIKNIAKEWPPVIDPSDGLTEDINTALQHMYNSTIDAITYGQLDGYGITYGDFNSLLITYGNFNKRAYREFDHALDSRFYMFSPVDGQYLLWRDVIWQLYRLHFEGEKYEDLNNANLSYEVFDGKNLTFGEFNKIGWL